MLYFVYLPPFKKNSALLSLNTCFLAPGICLPLLILHPILFPPTSIPSQASLPPGPSSSSKDSGPHQVALCPSFAGSPVHAGEQCITQVRLLPLLFLGLYVEFRSSFDFLHPGSPWKGKDRKVPNRTLEKGFRSLSVQFPGFCFVRLILTTKARERKPGFMSHDANNYSYH